MEPFFTQPATPIDEAGHISSPQSIQRPTDQEDCVHEVLDSGSCPDDKEPVFIAPSPGSMWSVLEVFLLLPADWMLALNQGPMEGSCRDAQWILGAAEVHTFKLAPA